MLSIRFDFDHKMAMRLVDRRSLSRSLTISSRYAAKRARRVLFSEFLPRPACHVAARRSALRLRVSAAFFAEAERAAAEREGDALPPSLPPLREEAWLSGLPLPDPLFLPPPLSLLTVAQARLSASFSGTPRDS
jgi:hypothetical protein